MAQALDLPLNAPAIRRERVTLKTTPGSEPVPVAWSISWLDGALAAEVPELLSTDRIPGGTAGLIAERTGQTVASGTDRICARGASEAEATALAIPAGLPVMAGTTTWTDETGAVIEYGQWIVPPGREITHRYRTS